MATLYLVETYCVPTMLYRCDIWYPGRSDGGNHENLRLVLASCLLFYSGTLPIFFMAEQHKILFWKKVLIKQDISNISRPYINMLLLKYLITIY